MRKDYCISGLREWLGGKTGGRTDGQTQPNVLSPAFHVWFMLHIVGGIMSIEACKLLNPDRDGGTALCRRGIITVALYLFPLLFIP